MSQVKRHLERYEELLNSINHYIEDELENDREEAGKLLSEIEFSINEHLPQGNRPWESAANSLSHYAEPQEPQEPEKLPEHFEIVEMSGAKGSYWIVARQNGRCPIFWQGPYISIEDAEKNLPTEVQLQYPLPLELNNEESE